MIYTEPCIDCIGLHIYVTVNFYLYRYMCFFQACICTNVFCLYVSVCVCVRVKGYRCGWLLSKICLYSGSYLEKVCARPVKLGRALSAKMSCQTRSDSQEGDGFGSCCTLAPPDNMYCHSAWTLKWRSTISMNHVCNDKKNYSKLVDIPAAETTSH